MEKLEELKKRYPRRTDTVSGRPFTYRYHRNPASDKTLVLLTGGIGLSDLLLFHFAEFAKYYSVITFDYSAEYPDVRELVDAVAGLLRSLDVKAYFVGQSLGGFLAQIIAKQHPDVTEGMVLSNTGTLSVRMDAEGETCLRDMLKRTDQLLLLIKTLPFTLVKRKMRKSVEEAIAEQFESGIASEFLDGLSRSLTKDYALHMARLLKDLENHWDMTEADFLRYEKKVLLILSEDDETFNGSVKHALTQLMPNPAVVTDIRGGHLALLLDIDRYTKTIREFIDSADIS